MVIKHSLKTKLTLFIILVIIIISTINLLTVSNFIQTLNTYDKSRESIRLINDIKIKVTEMDEIVQEYSISKNSSLIEKIVKLNHNVDKNMSELEQKIYYEESQVILHNLYSVLDSYYNTTITYLHEIQYTEFALDKYKVLSETKDITDSTIESLLQSELESNDEIYEYIRYSLNKVTIIFLIILLVIIILSISFAWGLSKDIYDPIKELVDGAEKISVGNLEFDNISIKNNDEIGYLTEVFNNMKEDLRKWIKDKEEQSKLEGLLKEAELKALQAQVNPHFLFNVLSIITESVLSENTDQTLSVVEKISYLLRYSLTSFHKEVYLYEEIKFVESYLYLQEQRFGSRIKFIVNKPNKLPKLNLPSMTIQPILENAIIHGTEHMKSGAEIRISIEDKDDSILVTITDNGKGIKNDVLNKIFNDKYEQHTGHTTSIGINNVIGRLKIFYGADDLLNIYSEEGKGTKVIITFPK